MFELNNIKYDFKFISVEDALEVQKITAEMEEKDLSKERTVEIEEQLRNIALKNLRLYLKDGTGKDITVFDQDADYYAEQFRNPFFYIEIIHSFGETIRGFLQGLPKLKRQSEEAKKMSLKGSNK